MSVLQEAILNQIIQIQPEITLKKRLVDKGICDSEIQFKINN